MTKDAVPQGESSRLSDELAGVALGDRRLGARAEMLMDRIASCPSASFPRLFSSDAELEATYRFLRNPSVTFDKLLAPHVRATAQRARQAGAVLVLHDTTEFKFSGEAGREGLSPLTGKRGAPGFLGHFALAVADDPTRRPLGVVGAMTIVRKPSTPARKRMTRDERRRAPDSEFRRWGQLVEQSERTLGTDADAVHVMDREGDDFDLLAQLVTNGTRFVIRVHHDRRVEEHHGETRVFAAMASAEPICEREVRLARRGKGKRGPKSCRLHPPRAARNAKLKLSCSSLDVLRPQHATTELCSSVRVNVVRAYEVDCPEGAEPVEWLLLTSEPIASAADLERVVDIYRARWTIEDYFMALKTGCAFESRQLESRATLLVALGLFIPNAWRLLLMRAVARAAPNSDPLTVVSETQLRVLVAISKKPLPDQPNAADVLMAIARLGGFVAHNKQPGWRVLGRGYDALLIAECGWRAHAESSAKHANHRNSLRFRDQ